MGCDTQYVRFPADLYTQRGQEVNNPYTLTEKHGCSMIQAE